MDTTRNRHTTPISRRSFTRLASLAGAVGWLDLPALAADQASPLPAPSGVPDEAFWSLVRGQFLLPRNLAQSLIRALRAMPDVKVWTSAEPERAAAIVTFLPGSLDAGTLADALYRNDRIACMARTGPDRPGLRVSPHFYNPPAEIDRLVAAVNKYLTAGV